MDGQNDNFSYDEAVDEIAFRYGVPKAVYRKMLGQESGDTDSAVSNKGAFTAWQIMPATARGLGYDPEELKREPLKAAEAGLRILRDNYKQFRPYAQNEKHAFMMAVAGYHGAPSAVLKDIKRGGYGLPDISDGAITTKQHVLKVFDGLTSDMFDRSPLGNLQSQSKQTSPDAARAVSVNPDDLPTVSLSPLAKQTLKNQRPLDQVQPPTNQTFNNPLPPANSLDSLPPVNQVPPAEINPMVLALSPNAQTPPSPTKDAQTRTAETNAAVNQFQNIEPNPSIIEPAPNVQTPGIVQQPVSQPTSLQQPVDDGLMGYPNRRPNLTGYDFERTGKLKLDDGTELELIKDEINRYEPTSFRFRDKNGQIFTANVEDDGTTAKISLSPEQPENNVATVTQLNKQPAPPQNLDSEYKTYSEFVKSQNKEPLSFEKFQKLVAETPDLKATATAELNPPAQTPVLSSSAIGGNSPQRGEMRQSDFGVVDVQTPAPSVKAGNDKEILQGSAGRVTIDLAKKGKNESVKSFIARQSLLGLASKYGLSAEAINNYLAKNLDTLSVGNISDLEEGEFDEIIKQEAQRAGNNGRALINQTTTFAVINDLLNQQSGESGINSRLREQIKFDELGTVEGSEKQFENARIQTKRDLAEIDSKRLTLSDEQLREKAKQIVSARAFIPGFSTTDADIEEEFRLLKKYQLSEEAARNIQGFGNVVKNNPANIRADLGTGANPDFAGGLLGGLGEFVGNYGGAIVRPFVSLGILPEDAYGAFRQLGQGSRIFENATKSNTGVGDVLNFAGRASVDIPKYIGLSYLPGGTIVAFGVDSAVQSAGRGDQLGDIGKETAKGLILGGIFRGAGKLSQLAEKKTLKTLLSPNDVKGVEMGMLDIIPNTTVARAALVSKLFGEGTRIGSVAGGVMALELASGEPIDEALRRAAVMTIFDVVMHGKKFGEISDLAGKVFRVSKNGKTADVTVEPNGDVKLLKGNVPDKVVEAEFNADKVIDVEMDAKGVYRPKGDTSPIREQFNPLDKSGELTKIKGQLETKSAKKPNETKTEVSEKPSATVSDKIISVKPAQSADIPSAKTKPIAVGDTVATALGGGKVTDESTERGEKIFEVQSIANNKKSWYKESELSQGVRDGNVIRSAEDILNEASQKQAKTANSTVLEKPSPKPIELPESSLKSKTPAPSPEQQTKLQNFTEKLETQGGQVKSAKLNSDGNIHVEWKRQNDASSREATIFKGGEMEGSLSGQKDYVQDLIKSDTALNTPNMPEAPKTTTTRRSLDAERLSVLDRKRADIIDAEYAEVSGKAPAQLIDNAKIEYRGGILYTNAEGTELLRQADYVAFSDADGSNFYGRYLNPKNSERIEKALDLTFGGTRFTDKARQIRLKRFIGEFRRARESSELQDVRQVVTATKRVPYGLKAARQEETAHGKDYAIGFQHRVSSNIFQSDGIGRRAMRHLKKTAYTGATKEILGREIGAKIWLDTATKDLNLNDAEIKHLRGIYIESLRSRKVKREEISSFNQVSRSAREFLKETGQNYGQSIEQSTGLGTRTSIGRNTGTSGNITAGSKGDISEGVQGTRRKVSDAGTTKQRGKSGKSNLKELPLFERKFIERESKGNTDLAERVASEILHSKAAASNKMTVGDLVIDITNMPKALKASVDLSAAGRQGLIAAVPHPIIASKSFGKQLGSLVSANYHKRFIEGLEKHPFREMAEKSGLYLSSLMDGSVNQREEQFMSRILGDDKFFENNNGEFVRKVGTFPIRASERAYSTFLDDLRINVFADLARQVHAYNERNGITKQELGNEAYNEKLQKQTEGIAKFVNYSTGRGSLGRFESAGEFLNIPFFSARYWASRYQVMNPAFYASLPPGARKAVMKDFGIFLGAMVSLFTLLKLSGADITVNPFSPDFLKLRVGQYSYDLSGGMVQQIRYLAQTTINVGTGEVQKAVSGTGRYIRSKLAPVPSSLYNLGTGTNFIGEPVTVKGEAIGLISPISVEQVYEGASKDGQIGVLLSSPDIFGWSTTRYDNSLEVGEKLADAERRLVAAKTKEEEKAIYAEVKAWRDLYYKAKKQPGELPMNPGREDEPEEFIKDDIGEPEEKRDIKVPLSEMIKFYDEKNKTLFSFAKDELESLIIQRAEYLNMRGRLTEKDLKEVRRIIPEYEPLDKLHPGVDHRPDKLKKPPSLNKDLPKPPKIP